MEENLSAGRLEFLRDLAVQHPDNVILEGETVLALLTRLEQAELLVRINNQAMLQQTQRAYKAEQAVARVREVVANLEDHSRPRTAHKFAVAENLRRALDGDTRG